MKKVVKVIVMVLILMEGVFVHLTFKSFSMRNETIENVNYKPSEAEENKKLFAYLLDDGNGNYSEPEERESWPDPSNSVYIKSICYDGDGTELNATDVVTFNESTFQATVNTSTTLYCYMYFSPSETPLSIIVKNSGGSNGSFETPEAMKKRNDSITGAKDDLRRFVGDKNKVTDNFICFGATDQNTCKSSMDTYMYRIIGVDASDRLKIIKATKIVKDSQNTFQWHSTYSSDTKWNSSSLYNGLNNGYFMQNAKYNYMQDQKWTNLIDPSTYYIGDSTANTNPTLFQNERQESFSNAKIGLMYLSDYLYASNANTSNWLFIANGLNGNHNSLGNEASAPIAEYEWTMTRYGYYGFSNAWRVSSNGTVAASSLTNASAVRPVFYLKSNVKITGKGTITEPYMISNASMAS